MTIVTPISIATPRRDRLFRLIHFAEYRNRTGLREPFLAIALNELYEVEYIAGCISEIDTPLITLETISKFHQLYNAPLLEYHISDTPYIVKLNCTPLTIKPQINASLHKTKPA